MGKGKKEKKPLDILAGSDDDSDGGGEDSSKIQINEEYARRFEHNKRREALQYYENLKKQGLAPPSDDEKDYGEVSSEEDEDAIASRTVDRRLFEVIRRIRSGDPAILDKDAKVYSSEEEGGEKKEGESKKKKKAKKEKPLYLKDVNARHLLEEGPEFTAQTSRSSRYDRIAYDEQQKKGLEAFLEAQKEVLGDDDDDDLFHEKPKAGAAADEDEDEEEKQTKELAGEVFGKDEELDENEKFLKEFFLKRPYLDSGKKSYLEDIQELSDEEELKDQEKYEYVYSFRHEEAEASGAVVADRVMGHSRVVEGSVRKKESSRKQQRKSKEERMARAKQEQAEELKHLKNLKKKEIAEKLERIRMIAGIEGDAACKLGADDLEEDFDPEDYDKKMQEMFDDSYYEADDVDPEFGSGEEMDLKKPDFDKEDELLGLPKGWDSENCKEESSATDGKATKGKISLKDKVELEKEMEEYYKLDYEDTIGDLKTRFKYKKVNPNSFGLSTYEILASDDKDLNQYVSMKKLAPYRESEWKITHHRKLSKDLILGGQKKQGSKGGLPMWKQVSISDALLTNEILIMRRIVENVAPHPNVIGLHDVYEDVHGVHLILELCSGGELFDRIVGRDRYSEFDAAAVVRQIARGLEALHKANIIHRDLKPENCLFSDKNEDSTLKIMDFGLSSVEDFSDPIVTLFGSIDYVSPEALSRQDVSAASDMWSVGVILYILLSGCPPFHAATNREKQQRILQGEFSFQDHTWKTISSSAKELISSLLSVEPYKRPTASDLLRHPWVIGDCAKQDLMDAEVVSKLQRFNARRKLRAAAIASVLSSKVALRTKRLRNLLGTHDLSSEELDNLRVHFARICADGENATLEEFEQVLKAMKMDALVPLAPRVFDLFDNNRDGTVDMREILCGLSSLRNSRGDDALRLCFQMYDADRSGCISKDELASMLRALPEDCLPGDITEPGKLDEVFDEMDANGDGKVTFDEFKAAMQKDSSLQDVVLSSLRPVQ
ncbi:calcium-dependent protein kinase 1 [Setaria italica]|uniref:calcium-dependent protein kinase 1 n=1 Tax=Setaria italica TaxID=4555 RepID=UPI000BE629C6|nr:calcium-dependent protein kinase 1 [Setaria italica]XP_034585951.1 calcium-dependent protein kinase 1-like [Setaria viridis]